MYRLQYILYIYDNIYIYCHIYIYIFKYLCNVIDTDFAICLFFSDCALGLDYELFETVCCLLVSVACEIVVVLMSFRSLRCLWCLSFLRCWCLSKSLRFLNVWDPWNVLRSLSFLRFVWLLRSPRFLDFWNAWDCKSKSWYCQIKFRKNKNLCAYKWKNTKTISIDWWLS